MNQKKSIIDKSFRLMTYAGLSSMALFFTACGEEEPKETVETAAAEEVAPITKSESSEPSYVTADERLSYGIGYNVGSNIAQDGNIDIDSDAFMAGLVDGLEGNDLKVDNVALQAASQEIQARAQAKAALASQANLSLAKAYLEENAKRDGVMVTESGLQYEYLVKNDDPSAAKPTVDDTVEVHYHGTLIDGTVFDSSVERGETISFSVSGVIAGWTEALQLMSVGDKLKIYLPPSIAYGERANGQIPPNSALIFEVELISIADPAEEAAPEEPAQ